MNTDLPAGAPAGDSTPKADTMARQFIRHADASANPFSRLSGTWASLPKGVRLLAGLLFAAFLYMMPWLSQDEGWGFLPKLPLIPTTGTDFTGVLTLYVIPYVIIALGLNVVVGQAGLLDLGYVGFFATGAYTVGVLTSKHAHWQWFIALIVAVAITMLFGVVLGAPTLRLRGDYLAIVTLGFGEIIRIVAKNSSWLGATEGVSNIPLPPSPLGPPTAGGVAIEGARNKLFGLIPLPQNFPKAEVGILDKKWLWVVGLSFVLLVMFALSLIEKSRVGRAWAAIREDEDAAELMGVPTFTFKLWAFAIGAGVGAIGGVFYGSTNSAIYPADFQIQKSILFIAAVVMGGLGNRYGAALGGFVVAYLPERLRFVQDKRYLVFGLILLLMMIFRPQGLIPRKTKARRAAPAPSVLVNKAGGAS
jgi:branched-chain amino acid transport system permease protein